MRRNFLVVHGFARIGRDTPEIHILVGHGFKHLLERVDRPHNGVVQTQHLVVSLQFLPTDSQQRLLIGGNIKPLVLANHNGVRVLAKHLTSFVIDLAVHDDDEIRQILHQIGKEAVKEPCRSTILVVKTQYA